MLVWDPRLATCLWFCLEKLARALGCAHISKGVLLMAGEMFIHLLEARRLLSSSLSVGTGLLTVDGSASDDVIAVTVSGANVTVTVDSDATNDSYLAADVQTIVLDAKAGNDAVTVDATLTVN